MEEDIIILLQLINTTQTQFYTENFNKIDSAIEHLIKSYKELEEENRIFATEDRNIRLKIFIDENYIPKSLVKEKKNKTKYGSYVLENFNLTKKEEQILSIGIMMGQNKAYEELLGDDK